MLQFDVDVRRFKRQNRRGQVRGTPQVTFIHPQWTGTNVHAKNDEGITLLDCIYDQLIMHINAVQDQVETCHRDTMPCSGVKLKEGERKG